MTRLFNLAVHYTIRTAFRVFLVGVARCTLARPHLPTRHAPVTRTLTATTLFYTADFPARCPTHLPGYRALWFFSWFFSTGPAAGRTRTLTADAGAITVRVIGYADCAATWYFYSLDTHYTSFSDLPTVPHLPLPLHMVRGLPDHTTPNGRLTTSACVPARQDQPRHHACTHIHTAPPLPAVCHILYHVSTGERRAPWTHGWFSAETHLRFDQKPHTSLHVHHLLVSQQFCRCSRSSVRTIFFSLDDTWTRGRGTQLYVCGRIG